MKLFTTMAAASVALVMAAPASAMVIDLFDGFQRVEDASTGGAPQGSEVADPGVLGGFRDLFVATTPAGTPGGTFLQVFGGSLTFNNGSGQTGRGQIAYDGGDGDPGSFGAINVNGLGGFDLTFGMDDPAFFFEILEADGNYTFSATVYESTSNGGDGSSATFSEEVEFSNNQPVNTSPFLPLAFFTGEGVDVTNIGALVFEIETTGTNVNIDGAIGSISVVPLPASSLLLLGSVAGVFGGMGAIRRRRRQA